MVYIYICLVCVDVIGAVEDFEKLSIIGTMFGDREIVKFRLTDGR